MPRFASTFRPDVGYWATDEYHEKIEELLGRLEAKNAGWAAQEIFEAVVQHRHTKGRSIYDYLARRYPGLVASPPLTAEEEAELLYVGGYMAETIFRDQTRSSSAIYDRIVQLEELPRDPRASQAQIDDDTIAAAEQNLDHALALEDAAEAHRQALNKQHREYWSRG